MCRVVDTVWIDQEIVYAPRQGNDRPEAAWSCGIARPIDVSSSFRHLGCSTCRSQGRNSSRTRTPSGTDRSSHIHHRIHCRIHSRCCSRSRCRKPAGHSHSRCRYVAVVRCCRPAWRSGDRHPDPRLNPSVRQPYPLPLGGPARRRQGSSVLPGRAAGPSAQRTVAMASRAPRRAAAPQRPTAPDPRTALARLPPTTQRRKTGARESDPSHFGLWSGPLHRKATSNDWYMRPENVP
jgi:hypothetical protein